MDAIVARCDSALDHYKAIMETSDRVGRDATYDLVSGLKKLSLMYSCHSMNNLDIWENLHASLIEVGILKF